MSEVPYINRSAVKKLALRYAREHRPSNKFTRVGDSFFLRINSKVIQALVTELEGEAMPLYIKRSEVKKLAKRMITERQLQKKLDAGGLRKINERVKEIVTDEVQRHPSIGKTLQ
jgi:hypothetical protein